MCPHLYCKTLRQEPYLIQPFTLSDGWEYTHIQISPRCACSTCRGLQGSPSPEGKQCHQTPTNTKHFFTFPIVCLPVRLCLG